MDIPSSIIELIKRAIEEDIGHGDITTALLVPEANEARALYIGKGNFVLAGMPFAQEVFKILDPSVSFKIFFNEGALVSKGDVLAEVFGKTRVLLAGERVSLNILQRLSGIATVSSAGAAAVSAMRRSICWRATIHRRSPAAAASRRRRFAPSARGMAKVGCAPPAPMGTPAARSPCYRWSTRHASVSAATRVERSSRNPFRCPLAKGRKERGQR